MRRTRKVVPAGRSGIIWLMADSTSKRDASISLPHSKLTEISALPRVLAERIDFTPGTGLTACSILRVTEMTIWSAGMSPASTLMAIRGKLVCGKRETGRLIAVNIPAMAKKRNNESIERR